MSMTKQDFELVADAIHEIGQRQGWNPDQWSEAIGTFSRDLATTNPRFNRQTFSDRCLVGSKPWAVIRNMPGYLPDNPPETFETMREAEAFIRDEAREYRELDGYTVRGSSKHGYDIIRCGELHGVMEISYLPDYA